MRLIDADKLMGHLMDWALHDNATEIRECMEAVKEQPTVDPVKHGHWVGISDSEATPRCSNCGRIRFGSSLGYAMKYVPYCEKCGAKMDEEG